MPRKPRRWEPNDIHHIDVRAHDGDPIFALEEDRRFVVERAARVFAEEGVTCFGWSVLINHFHMLLRFPGPPGDAMHRLDTAIAMRVRRRQGGRGPVFQDRYFGDPCRKDGSLPRRLGYVTANPVHHRVVPSLDALASHVWSSFGEVMGQRPALLVDRDAALALMEGPPHLAEAGFVDLMQLRIRSWDIDDAAMPIPRPDHVDAPVEDESPQAATGPRVSAWRSDELIRAACDLTGARPGAVRRGDRGRAASRARAIVAHLACDHLACPKGDVAAALGVSRSATVHARRVGKALLRDCGIAPSALLAGVREHS